MWACRISIHTLTWRVTLISAKWPVLVKISIHTLTWRVTAAEFYASGGGMDFNPHPHVEGDVWIDKKIKTNIQFQSTPSRGGWPTFIGSILIPVSFQSTPSRGGWQLHLVSLTPKRSIYRILYNSIQLIYWKSLSISTNYCSFECESPWYISDAYDSHSLFPLPESRYRINGPSMSYPLSTPMDSTVFL